MNRDDLNIPEPCDADWDAMTGDDRKRFCLSCTKHVHNLSEMSKQDATHLLDTSKNLCVQYASHSSGEVFFNDSTHPAWRLHRQVEGAKRLLAAALLVPLAAACDVPEQSPSAVSPVILINPDGSIKTPHPGAGLAPTMVVIPVEETPIVEDLIETTAGEPEVFHQETPPEIVEELGNMVAEDNPPKPDEIEMLQGDVAYVPDAHQKTEDTSEKQDTACDQDAKHNAEPAHDAPGITGTPPQSDHTILRGKVAPSHIKPKMGKLQKIK